MSKSRNSLVSRIVVLLCFLGVNAISYAAVSVVGSRHDLSSTNANPDAVVVTGDGGTGFDTTQTCVFCHTPHGSQARTGAGAIDAPLWNRGATEATFQPYASPTLDSGTDGAAPQPDGVSLACLSCHDGTVALDLLVNKPGVGGWIDPSGDNTLGGNANRIGFVFNRANTNNEFPLLDEDGFANVRMLGTDLRNDHPISIVYPDAATDPKFNATDASSGAGATLLNWFEKNANSRADDNEVRLYATKVQCASCHNPHGTDDGSGTAAYPSFLRTSMADSGLCTTCHIK